MDLSAVNVQQIARQAAAVAPAVEAAEEAPPASGDTVDGVTMARIDPPATPGDDGWTPDEIRYVRSASTGGFLDAYTTARRVRPPSTCSTITTSAEVRPR